MQQAIDSSPYDRYGEHTTPRVPAAHPDPSQQSYHEEISDTPPHEPQVPPPPLPLKTPQ